ncbi:Secretion protein HlyD [Acinetobacter baumannii]|nr:Secretion protein HlyD [Acinetobacter baumannii]
MAEFTPKTVQTEEIRTTLVYEVRVYVHDPNDQLKMGQPVTVNVPLALSEKAYD